MNTIKIIGTPLYQWEIGRQLQITPVQNMRVDSVHLSNPNDLNALVVKPKEKDGILVVDIPNILLQSGSNLAVYSVNVSPDYVETLRECIFTVRQRPKPSDYVYTEVEILNYETLKKRMDEFEKNGVSEKQIANAVESYMDENPVEITGVVKTVNGAAPDENGNVVVDMTEAVNDALAQAKASGEFDGKDGYTPVKGVDYFDGQPGKDGNPGADGAPGYTPVRGTDYYTEADKTEMVNAVLSALPTWTGGSY